MLKPLALATTKPKYNPSAVFWLAFVHLGALAAIPFFSWKALTLCLVMLFVISPLGVTMTYHRMLTHRSFQVPRWLEYTLAVIGVYSAQGSPLLWVAGHRIHHRYADQGLDPHSPNDGLFHSHMGHLLITPGDDAYVADQLKYVPDLASQPFYQFLHRNHVWMALSILPMLYLAGGWSFVLWGGFMRVTLMLHITWLVNSATHTWGYRTFETADRSRNLWWVALLAAGEGWHNNHHAQQNCAAHGREWWEFDLTWQIIQILERLGLATDVKRPKKAVAEPLVQIA